jgi:4-hydroxy-tetrahydrodipicolinate reductase
MRIALLGYGRMGHEIEKLAEEQGHSIVLKTDISNPGNFNRDTASLCDVAVEFTGPDAAADTVIRALEYGIPVVSGSTGWLSRYDEVVSICHSKNGSFIHSSNYSIGVNVLFMLNEVLARILSTLPGYTASIEEIHHTGKVDAPSGTAISLASGIMAQNRRYKGWRQEEEHEDEAFRIAVRSVREGNVTGIHSVTWRSVNDIITLRHEALNRRGLAEGAILAAEYIRTRKGVFTMTDILNL